MLKKEKTTVVTGTDGFVELTISPTRYGKFVDALKSFGKYMANQWVGIAALIVSIISLLFSAGVIRF